MTAWHNDNDATACAWMRELILAGLIPEGIVDERQIQEVKAEDLEAFGQCHFFAGIAGWPYALQLAGWGDRPVWSASLPCQPFSGAGKRKGQADERHLWPVFLGLVRECHPATIFGEQVASDDGYRWLARVRDDLEEAGYAVGAADLPACSQGAPHIRQRLFWVADATNNGASKGEQTRQSQAQRRGNAGGLAHTAGDMGSSGKYEQVRGQEGRAIDWRAGPWAGVLIPCADGKARRVEPEIFPLAHGVSGRVGILRGAGNSIVPQVAAAFVRAFLASEGT